MFKDNKMIDQKGDRLDVLDVLPNKSNLKTEKKERSFIVYNGSFKFSVKIRVYVN